MSEETAAGAARIDVLLATYNGAKYLEEQLASIEAQSHANWRLIARDDGSVDRTPDILAAFQARHPGKVTVLHDGEGNLGLIRNFSRLLEASSAPYAALCDQDDVWLPEKLAASLDKMRELEARHGRETPLLVFSDLKVVDESLRVIHESFWRYEGLEPDRANALVDLLLRNVVTGCTTLSNRALVALCVPVPAEALVHDWWMAVVAAATGIAGHLEEPTVLYRQHAANLIGAKPSHRAYILARLWDYIRHYGVKKRGLAQKFEQAEALLARHGLRLPAERRHRLEQFAAIRRRGLIMRAYYCGKLGCVTPRAFLAFAVLSKGRSAADRGTRAEPA